MRIGFQKLSLMALMVGISSCADDTVDMNLNLVFTNDTLSQKLLTRINEATQAGETLGMRVIYTYPSRNRGQGQVSKVEPTAAKPYFEPDDNGNATTIPRWETAQAPGVSYAGGTITLTGLPLGFKDTEIIVEILQQGASSQWYVIGFNCFKPAPGKVLTGSLLAQNSNANLEMTWGRSCGRCSDNETDFDEPDDLNNVCNDAN